MRISHYAQKSMGSNTNKYNSNRAVELEKDFAKLDRVGGGILGSVPLEASLSPLVHSSSVAAGADSSLSLSSDAIIRTRRRRSDSTTWLSSYSASNGNGSSSPGGSEATRQRGTRRNDRRRQSRGIAKDRDKDEHLRIAKRIRKAGDMLSRAKRKQSQEQGNKTNPVNAERVRSPSHRSQRKCLKRSSKSRKSVANADQVREGSC